MLSRVLFTDKEFYEQFLFYDASLSYLPLGNFPSKLRETLRHGSKITYLVEKYT